jgi:hypothetical protein
VQQASKGMVFPDIPKEPVNTLDARLMGSKESMEAKITGIGDSGMDQDLTNADKKSFCPYDVDIRRFLPAPGRIKIQDIRFHDLRQTKGRAASSKAEIFI